MNKIDEIGLLRSHIKSTIGEIRLDNLESLPHVVLIGIFRRIYFDNNLIEGLKIIQASELEKYLKEVK
tara:strand:- start:165 stop:368 length:204 start_codon:yes stop_codon:yes gene_type:complete